MTHKYTREPELFAVMTAVLLGLAAIATGLGAGLAFGTDTATGPSVLDISVAGNNVPPSHNESNGNGTDNTSAPPADNGTDGAENGTTLPGGNETGSSPKENNETESSNRTSLQAALKLTVDIDCTPASLPAGIPLTCRASVTNGTAHSFEWQFGNNHTATGRNATKRYETPGNQTVTLLATGPNGTTATATAKVDVGPVETPPTAAFTCSNTTLRVGESLSCSATNSTDERGLTSYEWQFGKDTGDADATGPTIEHRYTKPGKHTVVLTVTDTNQTTDTARMTVTVEPNQPPNARLECPTATLRPDHEFTCTATDSTDDGELTGYNWSFGEGTTTDGPQVAHAYDSPGNRTVTLTVTDDRAVSDTARTAVTVLPNEPPTIQIGCGPESLAAGQTVRCVVRGIADADGSVKKVRWRFDDGSTGATGRNTSHVYTRGGEYIIRATAVDDDGAETNATTTVTVAHNQAPTATIQADQNPPVVGETVRLRAANLTDPDGYVRRVNWSINSERAFGQVITYRFNTPGDHTVTLQLTDNESRGRTLRRTLTVLDRPSVTIERRPARPRVDQTIVMTAAGAPNGSRVAWDTDGDNAPEKRGKKAVIRFGTAGRHLVTATVTTPGGVTVQQSTALVVRQGAVSRLKRERQTAAVGEEVALRLRVSNRVDDRPIKTKLELDLPPGLSVVEAGGPGLDGPASTQFITVPAGQTTTLRVTVRADEPGSYRLSGSAVHYYAGQELRGETTLEPRQIEVTPQETATATDSNNSNKDTTESETTSTPTANDRNTGGGDSDVEPVIGASVVTLLAGFLLQLLR
jgi:PKD repeat protein